VAIGEGDDAVFFRTGHSKLWMVDNEAYKSWAPGIGMEAGK